MAELKVTLSASKIKTAQSCSMKYFLSYIEHLPDRSNLGATLGGLTHVILEYLAIDRRRKLVAKILKQRDIFKGKSCRGIEKLVYKFLHKLGIATDENVEKIKLFVLNGLSHDFYGEDRGKPIATFTEKDFLTITDTYKVRGFIDRLFIYENGHALIRDYKSSKATYQGEDASTSGIQATTYCLAVRELAAKKIIPPVKTVSVEFLFLKFDCNLESSWATGIYQGRETKKLYHNGGGKITLNYQWDEVKGFEQYLGSVQNYLENFTEKDAEKNYAATQPRSEDDSFSGPLNCGFGTYPGQLKKDGSLMFSCSYRHPFDYYFITQDDKWIASCFLDEREKLLVKYPIESYQWTEKHHAGCKYWQNRA